MVGMIHTSCFVLLFCSSLFCFGQFEEGCVLSLSKGCCWVSSTDFA
jgi:hypothetical protein